MGDEHRLIFDVGAHAGEDSDFYLKLGYRVIAVEANPKLVSQLKLRFANEISNGTYVIVGRAIGNTDTEIAFFVNKKSTVWGTADRTWAVRNSALGADSDEIRVKGIRFAEILHTYGCPYYLKIDIEGADMQCVRELRNTKCRPKYISIESNKTSWSKLKAEFDELRELGYTKFQVLNQGAHRGGHFRSLSGSHVYHNFEEGSSGPFGEHIEGKWLSRRQAIWKYVPIFLLYKLAGDNTFLSRHATFVNRIPILRYLLSRVSWYDTHAKEA